MSVADIAIRPATDDDAHALAPVMRAADRLEAEAATGDSPLNALRMSLARSTEAWAGTADGDIVCLFGVAPLCLLGGEACPWLLGSDLVERHAMAFARRNRPMVRRWSAQFPVLRNYVDARHTVAIRWLRWMGFTLQPPVPYGPAQLPFHPFEMRA
jgi:hypothetical protein